MAQQYLIDSNAVSDYLSKKLSLAGMEFMNAVIDARANISVITKIELLGFNAPQKDAQLLNDFVNDSNVIDLSSDVVEKTITIRKKYKLKIPDAIIAATVLVYDLSLITHDTSDFRKVHSLRVIDAYHL